MLCESLSKCARQVAPRSDVIDDDTCFKPHADASPWNTAWAWM